MNTAIKYINSISKDIDRLAYLGRWVKPEISKEIVKIPLINKGEFLVLGQGSGNYFVS